MGSFAGKVDTGAKVSDFDTFPAGSYELELIEASVEPTNAGDGELLKHRLRVIDGEQEGRFIFGNINISNPNPTAQKIGQGEFLALRTVTGVLDIPDNELEPEDLCFKRFTGVVKIQPAKGNYEAKNVVNWGATYKLFTQGAAPKDGKAPVAANDNKPTPTSTATAKPNKPWGARAA
jgi:hypothetical protein